MFERYFAFRQTPQNVHHTSSQSIITITLPLSRSLFQSLKAIRMTFCWQRRDWRSHFTAVVLSWISCV